MLEKRRSDDGWHIKRTVDLGHILTTVGLVLAAFWFFATLDKRISIVEVRSVDREKSFQEMKSDIKDIKTMLWEMKTASK